MNPMKLVVATIAFVALVTVARYTGCMQQDRIRVKQERVCYAWTVWQPYHEATAAQNRFEDNPVEERMHNGERLMRICVQSEAKMALRPLPLE